MVWFFPSGVEDIDYKVHNILLYLFPSRPDLAYRTGQADPRLSPNEYRRTGEYIEKNLHIFPRK